jgi:hypothetical protein
VCSPASGTIKQHIDAPLNLTSVRDQAVSRAPGNSQTEVRASPPHQLDEKVRYERP